MSVVLPFRRARPWLSQAMVSLAAERDLGIELIAVNDGCNDGSNDLLDQISRHWPPKSLQVLHTFGIGVSSARNLGLEHARAPLVAFLDADDRCLPGRLSLPVAKLQANPDLSHVMGGWQRIDSVGRIICQVAPWEEGAGFNWSVAMQHKSVLPSAWTLRKDAIAAVGGFDPKLSHAEDVDLLLRLAASGHRGDWIRQSLCRYRVHADSASRSLRALTEQLWMVTERQLQTLPDPENEWAKGVRYSTLCWCSWKYWNNGHYEEAIKLLRLALVHCPLPLARRPVHYLENLHRSCRREGIVYEREKLLASCFWQQARELLLRP